MKLLMLPVSVGEALDKMTILEIKIAKIGGINTKDCRLGWVRQEYEYILNILGEAQMIDEIGAPGSKARILADQLKDINKQLWDVEDDIREMIAAYEDTMITWDLDEWTVFAHLTMRVPELNDERARIKQELNKLLGSEIQEVKSYSGFELGE